MSHLQVARRGSVGASSRQKTENPVVFHLCQVVFEERPEIRSLSRELPPAIAGSAPTICPPDEFARSRYGGSTSSVPHAEPASARLAARQPPARFGTTVPPNCAISPAEYKQMLPHALSSNYFVDRPEQGSHKRPACSSERRS